MESSIDPDLQKLCRQFFQLVDVQQLRWPESQKLKKPDVQAWIYDNLFNSDNIAFLPPDRYRQRVLKLLMTKIESAIEDPEEDVWPHLSFCLPSKSLEGPEISDDLMNELSSLLSSTLLPEAASAQQKAYVTYSFPLDRGDSRSSETASVTLLESRSVISASGTTGLRTWEAALLFGSFLVSEGGRRIVQGRNVLELGAGTGMLSILCAKYLGVSRVLSTDGDESVVDAIKANVFLNGLDTEKSSQGLVRTAALKWGRHVIASTFLEDYGMELPDVVLGADVTYDRFVIPALVSTLREFFEAKSTLQVLIAATIRNERTFETFLNACKRNCFGLQVLDFPLVPEGTQDGPFYPTSTPIQIWRVTGAQE
ncbi:uncharacterized protein EI97DRAFT_374076 [Westerdykella ornata]|uniref:Uncharacterized protein n=1 Tax=Westerdykella ornata TaxID=318751 RepID=A0A6A6JNT1_WESOR|nr:uncharacterized protein EI97DRAFT_374076 [Westerdykella ornata]KAF2277924.1 hypothetical protein EI97DRAFT_374076 [Westerdykella ornata]